VARLRALFAHDHRFVENSGGTVSSAQGFGTDFWEFYLKYFDELRVAARRGVGVIGGARSDHPKVAFTYFPNLSTVAALVRLPGASGLMAAAVAECDAVIARVPSELGFLAARTARRLGRPYILEVVGCPWDSLRHYGSLQGQFYAPVMALRLRRAVRGASYVSYVTQSFLQRRYPPGKALVLAASDVDLPSVQGRPRDGSPRMEGVMTFGLIGSLTGRFKGIHVAIEALRLARRDIPQARLRVLGAGDPAPWRIIARQHGVQEAVCFDPPRVPGDAVLSWLEDIDVYLQPSFMEGLPRALVEAMSRGCPALGSTAGGIPEMLPAACMHAPGDAASLSRLMIRAATDANWRADQSRTNLAIASRYLKSALEARRKTFWEAFARRVAQVESDRAA
jgi:glycosyltransferase involved in cell wall biosynthesis